MWLQKISPFKRHYLEMINITATYRVVASVERHIFLSANISLKVRKCTHPIQKFPSPYMYTFVMCNSIFKTVLRKSNIYDPSYFVKINILHILQGIGKPMSRPVPFLHVFFSLCQLIFLSWRHVCCNFDTLWSQWKD